MSRDNEKTGKVVDMDFSALDQELAGMAADTPEVPADFHDRWIQAVREDAEKSPRKEEPAGADKTEYRQADARRQRRHILSAAAAFILVIGGVWLLKDRVDLLNKVRTDPVPAAREETVPAPAQEEPVPIPDPAAGQTVAETDLSLDEEEPLIPVESAADSFGEEAEEAATDYAAEGGTAGEAFHQLFAEKSEEISGDAESAYEADGEAWEMGDTDGWAPEAAVPMLAVAQDGNRESDTGEQRKAAAEAEQETEQETEQAETGEEPVNSPLPELTPAPTAKPETRVTAGRSGNHTENAAAAAEKSEGAAEENTTFLQRVWDFLLKITPWALGVIVIALFLVTYVLRVKQRRRKK